MHHYPFHPGDYMLDTAHLEPLEDLVYRRLLDLYYSSEAPIPDDNQKLCKRLRLGFQEFSDLVSSVLSEFFFLENGSWKHTRCEAEIAAYQRKKAVLSANGSLGGRPKKSKSKPDAKQKKTKSLQPEPEPEPEPSKRKCTLDEAKAFALELGQPVSDGEACFYKWEGNGWKNGTSAIKDWKATMRSWKSSGYLPSQKSLFSMQPKKTKHASCL